MDEFVIFSETTDAMNDLKVEGFDRELAWGFYRWPTAWPISWTGSHGPAVLAFKQLTRTSVDNWAIGNFSDGRRPRGAPLCSYTAGGLQSCGADHVEHVLRAQVPLLTMVRDG